MTRRRPGSPEAAAAPRPGRRWKLSRGIAGRRYLCAAPWRCGAGRGRAPGGAGGVRGGERGRRRPFRRSAPVPARNALGGARGGPAPPRPGPANGGGPSGHAPSAGGATAPARGGGGRGGGERPLGAAGGCRPEPRGLSAHCGARAGPEPPRGAEPSVWGPVTPPCGLNPFTGPKRGLHPHCGA